MAITVQRESLDTKTQHVSPSYLDKDGNQYLVGSDNPLPTQDISYLRLAEGRSFYAYKIFPFASKLPNAQSINIAIAWAAGITPSINMLASCGGDAELYIYENAVVTGGTSFTALKNNRSTSIASASAILIGPTVTSVGTLLLQESIPGGAGKKSTGSAVSASNMILSPLTTYLFRLTNVNGTDHVADLHLEWHE